MLFPLLCRVAIKCSLTGSLRFDLPLICAECTWASEYKSLPWLDPYRPLNLQKCKWLHDLQGHGSRAWFVLAGGDLGKGAPPVHPKAFLSEEDKDITKTGRWVTEKHQNFFSLQRLTQYPLRALKRSLTCQNWNVQLQKDIMGHRLHGICHAGCFPWRLN